jgi:HK97 family phage major capsid protein
MEEARLAGSISIETKNALEALGKEQRAFADRLLLVEQKAADGKQDPTGGPEGWGAQFVKSDQYAGVKSRQRAMASVDVASPIEVKNTVTSAVNGNSWSERRPGIIPGAFPLLAAEQLFTQIPTQNGSIDYMRESAWTNNAAETAEGVTKPQSAITFAAANMPMATVAHWLKISRQLADDNQALAAYIDRRLRFGVQMRIDTQLMVGNGTAPNLSGVFNTGNFVAHGHTNAQLGTNLKKLSLLLLTAADMKVAGYMPTAVIMNPVDVAQIKIDALAVVGGVELIAEYPGGLWGFLGIPVVEVLSMTAGSFLMGAFDQGATLWDRESVRVDMSESDDVNFQQNLITTVEVPAAFRAGTLTPA